MPGRVAIVTGAGAGMGRAYALRLAAAGIAVVVQDIDKTGVAATVDAIGAAGGIADGHCFDIADVAGIERMAEATLARHTRIDILVNNAGFGKDRALEDIDEAALDRMLDVHVKGTFFCTRSAVQAMKRQRSGSIVNISSRWAMAGHGMASDYIAAKSAILGFTKAWAKEFAPFGIKVNAIAPGGVWSRMALDNIGEAGVRREEREVPLGRWAQPDEIAGTLAFLVGEEASFVTGQVISPNGGRTIVGF